MRVEYGSKCDIVKWMELVRRVSWNFPGLHADIALSLVFGQVDHNPQTVAASG